MHKKSCLCINAWRMYLLKISGQVDNKIHVFRPHAPHRGHGLAQSPCTRLLSSMIVLVLDGHNITFSNPFDIHSNKRSPNYNTFLSTKVKNQTFCKAGPIKKTSLGLFYDSIRAWGMIELHN